MTYGLCRHIVALGDHDSGLLIVETTAFTRRITTVLDDEAYRKLQIELVRDPKAGALIRGSGGLRKIRWAPDGQGKSGAIRVIYYWHRPARLLLMLLAFKKGRQERPTPAQLRAMRRAVKEAFQ